MRRPPLPRPPDFRRLVRWVRVPLALLAVLTAAGAGTGPAAPAAAQDIPIDHIIVIYLENHSFDNLFGLYPGADGLSNADGAPPQVDADGNPYPTLPQPAYTSVIPSLSDPAFPAALPNQP